MRLPSVIYGISVVAALVKVVQCLRRNYVASVLKKMLIDRVVTPSDAEYMVGFRCTKAYYTPAGVFFQHYWFLWSETASSNYLTVLGHMNLIKSSIPSLVDFLKIMRANKKNCVVGIMTSTPDIYDPSVRNKLCSISNHLLMRKSKKL